jgi:AcrR family transcriptional regulator
VGTKADGRRSDATRARILAATAEVIRLKGFVGATTSAIAEQAGVNQGVIFYHFGSLTLLFGATLEAASTERLESYRAGLDGVRGVGPLLERAVELFAEDRDSGYVAILTEFVAGASAIEELRPRLIEHVERWVAFVEELIEANLATTAFATMLPPAREVALLVVSTYLGAELLTDLTPQLGAGEALSAFGERLSSLAKLAFPGTTT